jgi:hypothetical protein
MNPPQSQAFILDGSRGPGVGRVHDRYIISPRPLHDRLNQIQSLRDDTGNPCGIMTPLVQRPGPWVVSPTTAPCQSSTRRRAARTRSPPPWQLRWDGAGRCGSLPWPRVRTKASLPSVASRTVKNWPAGDVRHTPVRRAVRMPCSGTKRAGIGKASGSADRSFGPDAVRYMSVTIATP